MLDRAAILIYAGVFGTILATGLGMPIPEELPIVAGGMIAGHRAGELSEDQAVIIGQKALESGAHIHWYIMWPLCIVGVVIGDSFLYGIGRIWGTKLIETNWVRRFLPDPTKQNIEKNYHKYGMWVLLSARLLPTIRSPIFIMAGVMKLPFSKFVLFDGIYAVPGVSLLFWLGFLFGNQFWDLIKAAEGKVAALRPILFLLALIAFTCYMIWHFFRHPVATGDPKQEVPMIGNSVAARIAHESAHPAGGARPSDPPAGPQPKTSQEPSKAQTPAP